MAKMAAFFIASVKITNTLALCCEEKTNTTKVLVNSGKNLTWLNIVGLSAGAL